MGARSRRVYKALVNNYRVGEEVLGNGGKGTVFRGTRCSDGLEVAIKVVHKRDLNELSQTALAREVAVLKSMSHPNIVQFLDAMEDQRFVYIITEYLCGGDLYTRLRRNGEGLDERAALELVFQMLLAIKMLHDNNIAHRDIKLENFVFATQDSEHEQCLKLIDFGLVYWRRPGTTDQATLPCGTIQYCSPEVAARKVYVPEESDMWGVGVVLYALLSRKLPFYDSSQTVIIHKIRHEAVSFKDRSWRKVSESTQSLIRRLLSKQGADRPRAAEAIALVEACLHPQSVSDIEEDDDHLLEDDKGTEIDLRGPSAPSETGHKRQRSHSDSVRNFYGGSIMVSKRRDSISEIEDLSEGESLDGDSAVYIPEQGFFDGLCQAYGNI